MFDERRGGPLSMLRLATRGREKTPEDWKSITAFQSRASNAQEQAIAGDCRRCCDPPARVESAPQRSKHRLISPSTLPLLRHVAWRHGPPAPAALDSRDHGPSAALAEWRVDHHLSAVGRQGQGDGTADANGLPGERRAGLTLASWNGA